jgi:tRNA(Arg) A34 adenosine deaminase TadA
VGLSFFCYTARSTNTSAVRKLFSDGDDQRVAATRFELDLPDWTLDALASAPKLIPDLAERMRWVISLARTNFVRDTGGPFAAAVFEAETGRIVSIGVNRVVPTRCSSAHAELMALSLAQQSTQGYDLGAPGQPAHQIVVNWAPCAMCVGAICWSGVRDVVIAGSGAEMETLTGFDEGPIHPAWADELRRRGISVRDGVLREEALDAFRAFAASGRPVYNARKG